MEGVTVHKLRPVLPDTWPQSLKDLLARLWSEEPRERPTFAALEAMLSDRDAVVLPAEDAEVQFLQTLVGPVNFTFAG